MMDGKALSYKISTEWAVVDFARFLSASIIFSLVLSSAASASDVWQVRKITSKIDDSLNVIADVTAKTPVYDRFGRGHMVKAVVACRQGKTDFFIAFGQMFMADIQGYGDVTVRLDKEPSRILQMKTSTDHQALGLWNDSGNWVLEDMAGNLNMLIVATPYNQSRIETEISLRGFDKALLEVRRACRW